MGVGNMGLDDVDKAMVQALLEDGRSSIPALAERIGVGRATAYSRFDRLIDAGVITGFEAKVNPEAVGLSVAALILLTADQGHWADMNQRLLDTPGVQWVGMGAGSFDFIVLVRARDLNNLRDVVLKELLAIPGVRTTQTAILLDEAKPDGAIV